MSATISNRLWARLSARALALSTVSALLGPTMAFAEAAKCKLQSLAQLQVTMIGAQPTIPVMINGKPGRFMVDSGAFFSTMSPAGAARFGLNVAPESRVRMVGVGGEADLGSTTASTFGLDGQVFHRVDFLVTKGVGDAVDGVLGENILGGLDVEYDLANGSVRLFKAENCGSTMLAYWSGGAASSLALEDPSSRINRMILAYGSVNGKGIRVMFDTGAWRSLLTLKAAARAGVTPQTPGVTPGGQTSGFGARRVDTWIAPFDTFKLGDESIQHSRLRIGAGEMGESDMLLGADFFLSHRVYVARSQHKIYFTYNGGPVFNLSPGAVAQMAAEDKAAAPAPEPAAAAKTQAGPPDLNLPVDAAGFDRRGAAFVARLDYAHAIADFSRATELAPADPKPVYDRATAYIANHQPVLAMSDLDQVMRLKPDDVEALIARAALYAAAGDKSRARSDLDAAAKLAADPQEVMRIALLYDGMDLFEQAVVQFDRWIMINPKGERMAIALNGRCWARAVLKTELDKAMADCNAALKLVPRQPAFLDSRALVHQDCGEWDAAIADYDAVLKDHPKASLSLYARGVAKTRKGLKEDGAADMAAATTLAPKIADQAKRFGLTP